jgi:multidrug resistance efflux pump
MRLVQVDLAHFRSACEVAAERRLCCVLRLTACTKTVLCCTLPNMRLAQADLARARSAREAAAEEASVLHVEADSLRKAMRAMEGRLAEYQAKDTEVCADMSWGC